jgi:hypothetical protein
MFLGGLVLVLTILRGKDTLFSHKLRGVARGMFPFMILMGKVLGISRERVQQSFIEVNNQLVRSNSHRTRPNRLLILLPHCIQDFDCEIKITGNIKNCKGCGKCEIKDWLNFQTSTGKNRRGTGGTLARRSLWKTDPAIVCALTNRPPGSSIAIRSR